MITHFKNELTYFIEGIKNGGASKHLKELSRRVQVAMFYILSYVLVAAVFWVGTYYAANILSVLVGTQQELLAVFGIVVCTFVSIFVPIFIVGKFQRIAEEGRQSLKNKMKKL